MSKSKKKNTEEVVSEDVISEESSEENTKENIEGNTEETTGSEVVSEDSKEQKSKEDESEEKVLSPTEELEKRISELEAVVAQEKDKHLRAVAEIENVKKRKNQEIENTRKFANEKLILEFLPILDSFDRAKDHLDQLENVDEEVLNGFSMVTKQFHATFEKLSVETIDGLNEKFDPHSHQAVMSEENKEVEPDTVIRVLQTGYKLNGRVIRPSMVVVSK